EFGSAPRIAFTSASLACTSRGCATVKDRKRSSRDSESPALRDGLAVIRSLHKPRSPQPGRPLAAPTEGCQPDTPGRLLRWDRRVGLICFPGHANAEQGTFLPLRPIPESPPASEPSA